MPNNSETEGTKKKRGISRRDFLKTSAAVTAGTGIALTTDLSLEGPKKAYAANIERTYTTCPYCSVGCSMEVHTDTDTQEVVDVIGDPASPINRGSNCSKGSASIQIVNSNRRVGVPNSIHAASQSNGADGKGPMKRIGNGSWASITWDTAMDEIATAMVAARGTVPVDGSGKVTASTKGVGFLGCSHATNEENWLYRKLIANFGTNNVEHQARI